MGTRRFWIMGAAAGLMLAFGFSLGVRHASSDQAPVLSPRAVAPLPPVPSPPEPPRVFTRADLERLELRSRNSTLEREVKALRGELEAARRQEAALEAPRTDAAKGAPEEEQPLAFPKDVPEPYTAEGFKKVSLRAARECGMGLDVLAVDCSEYPCIAWMEAKDASVKRFSMEGCAPWQEAFQHGTIVVGVLQEGGTEKRFFSFMAVPPEPADFMIAIKRARERNEAMKAALHLQ